MLEAAWRIPHGMAANTCAIDQARWEELTRTATLVRAGDAPPMASPRAWRRAAITATYMAALTGMTIAALHSAADATPVRASGSLDSALFSLTNQDRASNGVRSLNGNGTLGAIAEGARYNGCGFAVYGRAVDMIQRNYFAHVILNCGQYVFSMMSAFGVHYMSAGENIGWNTTGSASAVNSAFMNSPDHRANILNGNYTDLGIGSDSGANWTGGGGSYSATMFSEEFAQLHSSSPPPPPPPPPAPKPQPRAVTPTRNTTPPPPPAQPAAAVIAATPIPTPTPVPTPTLVPTPTPLPTLTLPPALEQQSGLLFNSVESVLESYLIS